VSDRTTITRLRRELAKANGKLREAQAELKWRRQAMRGSKAEKEYAAQARAERNAVFDSVKRRYAARERLKKVDALAADLRGNEHERAVAAAMADTLRAKPKRSAP
jgi:hypothetical protein